MFILYGGEYDFERGDADFHVDQIFLVLYRELYYRHVYSRLQPDIDDRFHSYENSCELFNYLLSASLNMPKHLSYYNNTHTRGSHQTPMDLYRWNSPNSGCGI